MTQFQFALSVTCPRCHVSPGHWCRERGKAVAPHRERAKEALRVCSSALQALLPEDQILLTDNGCEPLAEPKYREYGGTIYRDGHVVEDSAEIADAIQQLEPRRRSA